MLLDSMGITNWMLQIISVCFVCLPSLAEKYSTPPAVMIRSTPNNKIQLMVAVSEFPTSLSIKRNATGHLISLEGVSALILDWLALRYQFNYSILDINEPPRPLQTLEVAGPNNPGLISYVVSGECDAIISVINPTPDRLRRLELVHPWFYTPIAFLIPIPEVLPNNVDAVIKPFQIWVWIMLIMATLTVIVTLLYFNWLLKKKISLIGDEKMRKISPIGSSESIYMYVVGTLLNQGGYISCKFTPIRIVVGAWCLLIFVLLNVYNGVLISYVTATRQAHPLINSVNDVVDDPNIHLILNKGLGADVIFSSAEKGLYKALGEKLRSYSNSRCNSTQQCVNMVKSTPHLHVYLNGEVILKSAIQKDYQETGKCKMTIAAKLSDGTVIGWGLAKNSPYLEKFNQGTLQLLETGLIYSWVNRFEPNPRPCWNDKDDDRKPNKSNKKPLVRLSLPNLTGAFVVLAVGYLTSMLVFLVERIIYHASMNKVIVI